MSATDGKVQSHCVGFLPHPSFPPGAGGRAPKVSQARPLVSRTRSVGPSPRTPMEMLYIHREQGCSTFMRRFVFHWPKIPCDPPPLEAGTETSRDTSSLGLVGETSRDVGPETSSATAAARRQYPEAHPQLLWILGWRLKQTGK